MTSFPAGNTGDSLECFFHNYEDVEIENLPRARKYHEFGNVGLMVTPDIRVSGQITRL